MIKQWILSFEWHRNYRWLPRISITPKIKHGQIGSDGGETGHFIYCKECSGAGTLFVPDEDPRLHVRPQPSNHAPQFAMDFNARVEALVASPEEIFLDITNSPNKYDVGDHLFTRRAEYVVVAVWDHEEGRKMELRKIEGSEIT